MKTTVLFSTLLAAVAVFAAAPTVSEVEVSQAKNRDVTVSYLLSGGAAFVTAEILHGAEPVAVAVTNISADVNGFVQPGRRSFVWKARKDWPDKKEAISARVTAFPRGHMPDYMVVDLMNPNVRSWYATSNDVPGGVTSMVYKTDKLVMRRIPARNVIWRMGQPAGSELCQGIANNESASGSALRNNETGHKVLLTEDFYMGIYEFTQRQYYNLTGLTPSAKKNGSSGNHYEGSKAWPVDSVSSDTLRGPTTASFPGWPQNGHAVAEGSFLRILRNFTGIESFDLPTEAQWEFACRAGTATSLNSGKNVSDPTSGHGDASLAEVGWSQYNSSYDERAGNHPNEVGLLKPNAFGLYDMHGNVEERCLDWLTLGDNYRATFAPGWERGAVTVDPKGPETGSCRILRGGDYFYSSCWMRSACRAARAITPDSGTYHNGFRLVCAATVE